MNRRFGSATGIVFGACLLAVIGCRANPEGGAPLPTTGEIAQPTDATTVATEPASMAVYNVYFPGSDGRLHAEARELPAKLSPEDRLNALADILVAGPLGPDLWPPLPVGTKLVKSYLLDDGRAILDFEPPDGKKPGMGTNQEILLAYSLADTILLNLEEANGLIILWQGEQPSTLAGHLDTTRPLKANLGLIAKD